MFSDLIIAAEGHSTFCDVVLAAQDHQQSDLGLDVGYRSMRLLASRTARKQQGKVPPGTALVDGLVEKIHGWRKLHTLVSYSAELLKETEYTRAETTTRHDWLVPGRLVGWDFGEHKVPSQAMSWGIGKVPRFTILSRNMEYFHAILDPFHASSRKFTPSPWAAFLGEKKLTLKARSKLSSAGVTIKTKCKNSGRVRVLLCIKIYY